MIRVRTILKLAALCLFLVSSTSSAATKVKCDVLAIQASMNGTGVDKALLAHQALFKQQPFAAYNSFALVQKTTYELTVGDPMPIKLQGELGGTLKLNSELLGKLSLTLTIVRKGKLPVTIHGVASPGAPFFAAGFKNQLGALVFGISCDHKDGDIVVP